MSLPFFNLYPRDFEADTSHLTLEEDGAYNRLLRLCWMTPGCSLPDDDAWIMRRMRVDAETFERVVRVVLDEFFTRSGGRVSNARLARECSKSAEAHQRRVSAGSMGGKAKALKTKETALGNAKAMPKQPEPKPEPIKDNVQFSQFWDVWPHKKSKADAQKAWAKLTPEEREAVISKTQAWCRQWRNEYPNASHILPASFLRGRRWEDEASETTRARSAGEVNTRERLGI